MELLAGARFVGRDHPFFKFGKCQSANCIVVLQLRLDPVAFGVRGSYRGAGDVLLAVIHGDLSGAGSGVRGWAVLQVDDRDNHPRPDPWSVAVPELGGEPFDVTAQLSERRVGQSQRTTMQVDLPAAPSLLGPVGSVDVGPGGVQHRAEELSHLFGVGSIAGGSVTAGV